jgi:hypothetical protein
MALRILAATSLAALGLFIIPSCSSAGDDPCTDGQERSCYEGPKNTLGVGECVAGKQVCTNGAWGECNGQSLPSAEACNGADDDCNGAIDETCPCEVGLTAACYPVIKSETEGVGPCHAGTQTCTEKGWGPCEGAVVPQVEYCNGKDDNCNGVIDDGCL